MKSSSGAGDGGTTRINEEHYVKTLFRNPRGEAGSRCLREIYGCFRQFRSEWRSLSVSQPETKIETLFDGFSRASGKRAYGAHS